jgi:hypothetical protein
VKKFSGRPEEEIVVKKEKDLRSQLLKDGLKPQQGCLLARYNDPRTKSFVMVCSLLLCAFLVKLRCEILCQLRKTSVYADLSNKMPQSFNCTSFFFAGSCTSNHY